MYSKARVLVQLRTRCTTASIFSRQIKNGNDEAIKNDAKAARRERIRQKLERRRLEAAGLDSTSPEARNDLVRAFLAAESEREAAVDMFRLSQDGQHIREKHRKAAAALEEIYEDPKTGLMVLTRWRHFLKAECCGNACRHCIYDHQKVKPERREMRRFNTAFWEDIPEENRQ